MGNINQATPNLEDLLQFATTTLREGNKQGAQVLLQQVLEADKRNDRAWVLLAFTTDDLVDRRRCLKTALRLNPNNTAAKRALAKMKSVRTKSESKAMYYGTIGLVIVLLAAVIGCVAVVVLN